jgi:biotin-(acetyl-CoA carboxylase) ligase
LEGVAEDLDDHGRLLVATGDGTVAVAAGDVVHVRARE